MFTLPTYAFQTGGWTREQLAAPVQTGHAAAAATPPLSTVRADNAAVLPQTTPLPKQVAAPTAADAVVHDSAPHFTYLMQLPAGTLDALQDSYVCTYEVKDVFGPAALAPSARSVLPDTQVATVYDAALRRGVRVLGIAPAHRRNGKWTTAIAGDPPRVYVGPSKLPVQAASVFCAPPQPRRR